MTEALSQTLQAIHKAGCISLVDVVEGRFPRSWLFSSFILGLEFKFQFLLV